MPFFEDLDAGVYDISIGGGSMAATLRPQEGRSAARTLQVRRTRRHRNRPTVRVHSWTL